MAEFVISAVATKTAEIVLSAVAKTAECAVGPIALQFGYMWDCKSNFQNLESQVQKLKDRREMVQRSIDAAENDRKVIEQHVVEWLDSVNKMIAEAEKIITDNNQANMRCFKRWCPDLKKRYQRGKNAAVKANDVSELEKKGHFDINQIACRTNPKETWHPSCKLYEDFESRRSTVDDILNELRDPDGVNMVRVHGMPGIGKTTLAREVGKQAEEQKLFDAVVFVEISEKPDIRKIQEAIADKLGLEFRESSESGRAMILCERLKKESKLLLILDNIWKGFELDKVGIPFGNDHPGCKLLLTVRSIDDVLSNDMSSQKNFPINGLKEKEAWDLFQKVAGACIEQDNLESLASDVAKRCGDLPIAIVAVAIALKGKPVHAWRNALRELQRPCLENLAGLMTAQTYSCIELSYNQLENDELKSTFLLCCTMGFPSNASVEKLLRYGMGLRLFKRVNTMEEARDRVNTLVQKLKESYLLLDNPANGCFSIHDVFHGVGRAIASKDHKKIIMIDSPRELNDKNIMKNCTSLSLYDIPELPNNEFDCPQLEFLYMESNSNSLEIPDNFFRGMTNLRVLHFMEKGSFPKIVLPSPSSLGCLVNLRTLCLERYILSDLGFIEVLKDLEILVLSCSMLLQFPKEVGQLTKLMVLDLSRCYGLKIIPPNTISKLTKLEELYMPHHFNQWQVEGVNSGRSNVSLEELKYLTQLTTLQICIQDAKIVPQGLFSQKLQSYEIRIGADRWYYSGWDKTSRLLALEYDDSIDVENIVVKQLKGIEDLYLIGKQGVKNGLYEFNKDDFPQLKHFDVQGDLVYIVDSSKQSQPCEAFPRLETLSVRNVISLEKICHGQLMPNSFCRLRNIKVEHCDKLKNFFSFSIASHLSQLQEIEVTDCENMEEFFTMGRRNEVIILHQLQFLCLKNLPKLRRFCSEAEVASSSDQEKQMLDTPMPFFDGKVEFPNLKTLQLYSVGFEKMWHNQLPSMSSTFQNLTNLNISDCCNLKYIFTSSTLRSFVQLQRLEIHNCKVLEEIIRIDDLKYNVELPSLKKLSIGGCPEMKAFVFSDKGFCSGNIHNFNFPSLETFIFDDLPKTVIRTLNQGSSPMSMDFHPVQQTLLLVGTNVGDIGLWEVGSSERLVLKNFKVWELSACTMPLQAALVKDPDVSVNRVIWSPDGSLFGVAYSRHIVQIYSYNGGDDVRQHLEIDAHVGGVNDLAFSHPNKQLYVITCGDDKTIKVWDAATGAKQYIFEGHDAPVYSVCPPRKRNFQKIFSTSLDGKIKAWCYDNMGSRVDYDAPGRWCTTMAYSADSTRLFSCGTSKDGESYIVERDDHEGYVKRTYQGFRKQSLGVVQFDMTKNRFLAAGDDFSIKFWEMDNVQLLNSIDADGGLPACPRIRFNKDGSLLAVSANENGIKILANSQGKWLLRNYETLSYDASRTSEASKPAINPISAAATSAGLADRGASLIGCGIL